MEKETVLILLLLKPMTKTSQLNDIAVMIYHGECPVLRISIPCFFAIILMKHENEKEIVLLLLLKPMTKNKSTKWKIQRRFFHIRTLSKITFQDGGLKVSFHGL